jgi:hypothetical protein
MIRSRPEVAMVILPREPGEHRIAGAQASTPALWRPAREAEQAAGWAAGTEGLCHGPICVPLPAERELVVPWPCPTSA